MPACRNSRTRTVRSLAANIAPSQPSDLTIKVCNLTDTVVSAPSYEPLSRLLAGFTYVNGLQRCKTYDCDYRLIGITANPSSGATAVIAPGLWLKRQLAIDSCLDEGGRWDYSLLRCDR